MSKTDIIDLKLLVGEQSRTIESLEKRVEESAEREAEKDKQIALLSDKKWKDHRFKRGQKQFQDWLDKHTTIKTVAAQLMRASDKLENLKNKHIL